MSDNNNPPFADTDVAGHTMVLRISADDWNMELHARDLITMLERSPLLTELHIHKFKLVGTEEERHAAGAMLCNRMHRLTSLDLTLLGCDLRDLLQNLRGSSLAMRLGSLCLRKHERHDKVDDDVVVGIVRAMQEPQKVSVTLDNAPEAFAYILRTFASQPMSATATLEVFDRYHSHLIKCEIAGRAVSKLEIFGEYVDLWDIRTYLESLPTSSMLGGRAAPPLTVAAPMGSEGDWDSDLPAEALRELRSRCGELTLQNVRVSDSLLLKAATILGDCLKVVPDVLETRLLDCWCELELPPLDETRSGGGRDIATSPRSTLQRALQLVKVKDVDYADNGNDDDDVVLILSGPNVVHAASKEFLTTLARAAHFSRSKDSVYYVPSCGVAMIRCTEKSVAAACFAHVQGRYYGLQIEYAATHPADALVTALEELWRGPGGPAAAAADGTQQRLHWFVAVVNEVQALIEDVEWA